MSARLLCNCAPRCYGNCAVYGPRVSRAERVVLEVLARPRSAVFPTGGMRSWFCGPVVRAEAPPRVLASLARKGLVRYVAPDPTGRSPEYYIRRVRP